MHVGNGQNEGRGKSLDGRSRVEKGLGAAYASYCTPYERGDPESLR